MKRFTIILGLSLLLGMGNIALAYQTFHGHGQGAAKIDYDSLFDAAKPVSELAEGKQLIDDCLNKYGGVEILRSLKSYRLELDMNLLMSGDTVRVNKYFSRDRKYKVDREGKNGPEVRIVNGQSAWFATRDTIMSIDGGRYCAELFSYLTMAMPLAMADESFTDIRFGTRVDDSLGYIYLKKNDSLMIVLGIDRREHVIKSSEGIIYQDTLSFVFVNKFSDFKQFGPYLFPQSLINISMGLEVGRSRIIDVDVNPAYKPEEFLPQHSVKRDSI